SPKLSKSHTYPIVRIATRIQVGDCSQSPSVAINIRDDSCTKKHLLNRETAFNLHKAKPDHRGRGKRLRLPSPRQIENAPPLLHAKPWPSCAGRFRSWLTVIRPELEKLEVSTPTTPDE